MWFAPGLSAMHFENDFLSMPIAAAIVSRVAWSGVGLIANAPPDPTAAACAAAPVPPPCRPTTMIDPAIIPPAITTAIGMVRNGFFSCGTWCIGSIMELLYHGAAFPSELL